MKAKKMQTKRVIRQVFCMLLSVALLCVQFSVLPINNAVADTAGTSINFDPNDGMITYGHTGTVGARAELETDNFSIPSARPRINFPADVIKYFDDYDENNPYYDYGPMFNKALELARGCKGKIFCDELRACVLLEHIFGQSLGVVDARGERAEGYTLLGNENTYDLEVKSRLLLLVEGGDK